jgi:hypothetical protein
MKVLLVGAGAVGEAIAMLARRIDPRGEGSKVWRSETTKR